MRRRRRRRAEGGLSLAIEDAFDLFLDALTNTLGVVIFICIMVVLFSAPPRSADDRDESKRSTPSQAKAVAALLEEAKQLELALQQAPVEGDPVLRARAAELLDSMTRAREALAQMLAESAEAADAAAKAAQDLAQARRDELELENRRRALERRIEQSPTTASFVRVSRFHDDSRKPLLLLVAGGALERAEPVRGETRILPGARNPRPIRSIDQIRAAVGALLAGISPSTHRLEIGVWSDSFTEYKLLERQLVELGFDLNPLPVEKGAALEAGSSGVQ